MERIQDRHQENSALTYYDDLGLPAAASDGEIREAYLQLVRMLHPEMQREISLKRFADSQMKRVSRAYAVLSDSDRRRRYDTELERRVEMEPDAPAAGRTEGRSRARAWITLGWLVCAFAGAVGIGWYMSQQSGTPPAPSEVRAAPDTRLAGAEIPAATGAPAASAAAPNQTTVSAATGGAPGSASPGSMESNLAESKPAEANSSEANPSGSPPSADSAELESLRSELASAKTERDHARDQISLQRKELDFLADRILASPPRAPRRFNGVWVAPKASPFANSSYAPNAADLIVTEDTGTIRGQYRARYPTMGRPEATVVNFYFEGKSDYDVANLTWKGDAGAKGDVQLRLVSANALELVWSATEMGKEAGPGSGTVLLVRRREP